MNLQRRSLSEMQKILASPSSPGPVFTYWTIRDLPIFSNRKLRCDLTYIPSFRLGQEFNKTFGHVHRDGQNETYQVLWGKALFILQKMDDNDHIAEIVLRSPKRGEKIKIDGWYYHTTINIGSGPLILLNWLEPNTENDYHLIEQKHGFGYYVLADTRDNFQLVKNNNYASVPEIRPAE